MEKKYLNTREFKNLYYVMEYLINEHTYTSKQEYEYDLELFNLLKEYNNTSSCYCVKKVESNIRKNKILKKLNKTISEEDRKNINNYIKICGEDTKEFICPTLTSSNQLDFYDLYLYYQNKMLKKYGKSKQKVKTLKR